MNPAWEWIDNPQTDDQRAALEHLRKTWRTIQRKVDDHWEACEFEQLIVGDVFKAYEPNGDPVDGGQVYRVMTEPRRIPDQPGNWLLNVDRIGEQFMPDKIIRSEDEINEVLNWAQEGEESQSRFPGMSYEQGIHAMYDWLVGATDDRPDC